MKKIAAAIVIVVLLALLAQTDFAKKIFDQNYGINGKVVSNGVVAGSCTADPSLPVSVGVETNETITRPDGKLDRAIRIVCMSTHDAAQYPVGSTYPKG